MPHSSTAPDPRSSELHHAAGPTPDSSLGPICLVAPTDPPTSLAHDTVIPFGSFRTTVAGGRASTGAVTAEAVLAAALEQVMRFSDADEDVLLLLPNQPGTLAAATATGRLLSRWTALPPTTNLPRVTLRAGCPLLAYGCAADLDVSWRQWTPPVAGSLYADLLQLRSLLDVPADAEAEFSDAYAELETLRNTALGL